MQQYDTSLKLLLRQASSKTIQMLSGVSMSKWLDVELLKAQNLRVDLPGEDAKGGLHHFELQSTNE